MYATTFSCKQVIQITGVSQRQLAYWRHTNLVTPGTLSNGGHARYSFTDLIIIRTIKQLLDGGSTMQRIRKSVAALRRYLPTVNQPLTELTLVATGDTILVLHEGSAFEAISGQACILPLAQLLQATAQRGNPATPMPQQPAQQELVFTANSTPPDRALADGRID